MLSVLQKIEKFVNYDRSTSFRMEHKCNYGTSSVWEVILQSKFGQVWAVGCPVWEDEIANKVPVIVSTEHNYRGYIVDTPWNKQTLYVMPNNAPQDFPKLETILRASIDYWEKISGINL